MNWIERKSSKGDKITFYYDFGREPGQRPSTGIFIYIKPKNQIEKNHNKEAQALLATKKLELILNQQAIGSAYIPSHKLKANFLDFYAEYVKTNAREGNGHLPASLKYFKEFIWKDFISPVEITEQLCKQFRQYLLDRLTGETPSNYFSRFKWALNTATTEGFFHTNPVLNVKARRNPSTRLKENLEVEEYLMLLRTPFFNEEISEGFIFSCYTGLRFVDVNVMEWGEVKGDQLKTRIIQSKTGRPVILTLHKIAQRILEKRRRKYEGSPSGKIFALPTANGCNQELQNWVERADIEKHITWSCARLSFSILLKDKNVDDATLAYLLGHTSTAMVQRTYKRHRPKDQTQTISHLPSPEELHFLQA